MTPKTHTTNYINTFIQVADDCPVDRGVVPPVRAGKMTIAGLQYEMLAEAPYQHTSDDVIFETSSKRREVGARASKRQLLDARTEFFSKGQACLRASGLGKQFGWGIHSDENGRIAIFAVESAEYRSLASNRQIKQTKAMRSSR